MNNQEIIQWLEAKAETVEKEGRRIAAKTLAETAAELRQEIERRNAANIAALDRKQAPWASKSKTG